MIKFRAWDAKEKRMFTHYDGCGYLANFFWDCREIHDGFGRMNLMQFTGLKDKKGKEIYAGDLVRQHGTLYEIRPCIGGFECQVWREFKLGGAEEGSVYIFSCLLDTACEIIGNIHENSELLK